MKTLYILLATILCLSLQLSYSAEAYKTITNPVEHMLKLENVTTNDAVMFFEMDLNNDDLPELFLSSSALSNGNMGHIYDVYINKGDKYLLYPNNYLTLWYSRVAITHDLRAPIVIFFDDSAWGYCLNKSNSLQKVKLISGYKLEKDYEYSSEIFDSILASTREGSPLIETNMIAAVEIWNKRIATKETAMLEKSLE